MTLVKRTTCGILALTVLAFIKQSAAELPPEILADRHLIQAEQLHAEGDHAGALLVMKKIIVMQREHNFKFADEFYFKYARVAMSADSIKVALDSANRYLSTAGRTGEFYKEALALSLNASEELDIPEIKSGETCAGKPVGSSCWMALSSHPDCYVWNPFLQEDATATWSGRCSGGVGRGEGTLIWNYREHKIGSEYTAYTATGRLDKGRHVGKWEGRSADGTIEEGVFVRGERDGLWVKRLVKPLYSYLERATYSVGSRQGVYEMELTLCRTSNPIKLTISGEYVSGEKHGRWVNDQSAGGYGTGLYKDGLRQGDWRIQKISCSDGNAPSRLASHSSGPFKDGKKHGHWREPGQSGAYKEGMKHGEWRIIHKNAVKGRPYRESGFFVEGKRHGYWVERIEYGDSHRGAYFSGKRNGTWHYWDNYKEKCWSREYRHGVAVGKSRKANKNMCGE